MERIICLVVGYAFGLIESGYLYGKMNGINDQRAGVYYGGGGQQGEGGSVYEGEEPDCHPAEKPGD